MSTAESLAGSGRTARRVTLIAVALIVVAGTVFWYLRGPASRDAGSGPAAPPAVVVAAPASPATPARPATSPAASAPAKVVTAPPATKPASPTTQDALQRRLDALAKAYNAADPQAAENAMWPNHAVVRPNGKTLERSELLGQWMTEWRDFKDHQLYFVIDQLGEDGSVVTAVVDLRLIATLVAPDGQHHEFELTGTQRIVYERVGEDERLLRPIEYLGYERTIDGQPWHDEQ